MGVGADWAMGRVVMIGQRWGWTCPAPGVTLGPSWGLLAADGSPKCSIELPGVLCEIHWALEAHLEPVKTTRRAQRSGSLLVLFLLPVLLPTPPPDATHLLHHRWCEPRRACPVANTSTGHQHKPCSIVRRSDLRMRAFSFETCP